jgi:AraC-like DNA-binding protein
MPLYMHGELSHNICNCGHNRGAFPQASMRRRRDPSGTATLGVPSTIRAFFLAPLVRELGRNGIEIDGFLRKYGLSAAQLTTLYERVPLQHFVSIIEDLARRLKRPFLGLELGQHASLADLGPFYAMCILARDLNSALNGLARYQSAWQTNTLLDIVHGNETSACRYLIPDPTIWPRRQDAEFALAALTALVRQLTSSRWHPAAVEFEHNIAGRATTLRQFFKAPVSGNRPANLLIISKRDMEQPLRWRLNPDEGDIAPILEQHLRELLAPPPAVAHNSYVARVGALVARRVGRAAVTIDAIAAEMSMSVRTLRRHLTQEGSSFREILRMHRRTMMESILRADDSRLGDLAGRLSYSDGAVLSRAFKSWTGMSPRKYVKSRRE